MFCEHMYRPSTSGAYSCLFFSLSLSFCNNIIIHLLKCLGVCTRVLPSIAMCVCTSIIFIAPSVVMFGRCMPQAYAQRTSLCPSPPNSIFLHRQRRCGAKRNEATVGSLQIYGTTGTHTNTRIVRTTAAAVFFA